LRPSGKAGPLVIPLVDLQHYLLNEAEPWERQAYLKARWIGDSEAAFSGLTVHKSLSRESLLELDRIRRELISTSSLPHLKYSEGGLVDVEFAAQVFVLQNKLTVKSTQTSALIAQMTPHSAALLSNYRRLRQIEQMFQLVASENSPELSENHESFRELALLLQTTPHQLILEIKTLFSSNIALLKELDPRRTCQ